MKRAEPFEGSFPEMSLPIAASGQVHKKCAASLNAARMALAGYDHAVNKVNIKNPIFLLFCLIFPGFLKYHF